MNELYTKLQADRKLLSSKFKQETLTCPVFKKQCFKNCASFNSGYTHSPGEYDFNYKRIKAENEGVKDDDLKIWTLYKCSCTNAIVTGYVQCDMDI